MDGAQGLASKTCPTADNAFMIRICILWEESQAATGRSSEVAKSEEVEPLRRQAANTANMGALLEAWPGNRYQSQGM